MNNLDLEMFVDDAIFRIKREYKRCKGKIYLSFSGGKDSTVLAELIKMAKLPTKIPFVFADTGIEMDAIKTFVKNYDYENIVIVKPRKPYGRVLKDYGYPVISKLKSTALNTYQRHINNPFDFARTRQLITGEAEKNGIKTGKTTRYKLADKHFHFLHKDHEYKIANMCCQYMKKYPFQDFEKEYDMRGSFSGVRVAEGGTRSLSFNSCVTIKNKKGESFYSSIPIFDWTDETVEAFINQYQIKLSDAYNVYGLNRTGCVGCPFSQNIEKELEVIYKYEPLRYKAAIHWMKDIYIDQGVKLEFDREYMKDFNERSPIIKKRRLEMLEKYRGDRR